MILVRTEHSYLRVGCHSAASVVSDRRAVPEGWRRGGKSLKTVKKKTVRKKNPRSGAREIRSRGGKTSARKKPLAHALSLSREGSFLNALHNDVCSFLYPQLTIQTSNMRIPWNTRSIHHHPMLINWYTLGN
jgi:hypothetical protein